MSIEKKIENAIQHGRLENSGQVKRCGWICDTVAEAQYDVDAIKITRRKAWWHQNTHPTAGIVDGVHVTFFDPVESYVKPYSMICRVMNEVNHWRFGSIFEAKSEGTAIKRSSRPLLILSPHLFSNTFLMNQVSIGTPKKS